MSIKKDTKKEIISKFATNEKDTGSAQVQIAVLSERISNLTEHFKLHKHDNHSKKGLVALVVKRKKLLSYISKKDNEKYKEIIKELKIRG
tara:strand:+ start:696 stop:965 length:270 start_codon:yes stop_codon:yes gene_type:complete